MKEKLGHIILSLCIALAIVGIFIVISIIPKDLLVGSVLTILFLFALFVSGKAKIKLTEKTFERERKEEIKEDNKKVA